MKCRMIVYSDRYRVQDVGEYDSVQDARNDWRMWDKPRGMHHAIIEKKEGGDIYLGKR